MVVPEAAESVAPGGVGRIVFQSHRHESQGEIYTRDFAGGAWTRLTNNIWGERGPAWSPDGTTIAYSTAVSGSDDIWLMNPDGTSKRNVTNDSAHNLEPSWSPDGARIAYTSIQVIGATRDVWVMNADGSGKANLTPSTPTSTNEEPAWSSDGSKIAFTSDRDGASDIFVMNVRGSGLTNLTKSATSIDTEAAWSPDSSAIAFISDRSGSSTELYVMGADGSVVRRLTTAMSAYQPAWSPDGRHILFSSSADGDSDLWMVDSEGGNLGHVTDSPDTEYAGDWESVNRLPSAVDDGPYEVQYGGVLNGASVLANDTDPDGEALVAQALSAPDHALAFTLNSDGTFVYQHHNASFSTSDSFTYQAVDTRSGVSNVATASITILPGSSPTFGLDTVGLVDPLSGLWHLHDGVEVVDQFYYGNPGDYPFVGDWDCLGRVTPGLYRQSDGFAYLRNSTTQGNADLTFFFGNPGDVPIAGDFNADGCDTLSIYRPSNQRFYIINELGQDGGGLGAADYEFLFGNPGDTPVVGDWDGDGVDEIGLYRESSGFFYYRNTLTTGVADGQFYFGNPGDRFVAGDWGVVDGRETPGLFRPSNQTFYFRYTLTQGNADAEFTWTGAATDWLPVGGNFNLD